MKRKNCPQKTCFVIVHFLLAFLLIGLTPLLTLQVSADPIRHGEGAAYPLAMEEFCSCCQDLLGNQRPGYLISSTNTDDEKRAGHEAAGKIQAPALTDSDEDLLNSSRHNSRALTR